MKHKHAEIIKAFVDGINCQYFQCEKWWDIEYITQFEMFDDVRIKPEPKEDIEDYLFVADKSSNDLVEINWVFKNSANLRLIWDGETGELKDAEVIK